MFRQMLCVSRTSTPSAAMKLISPRDFVDLVLVKKYEDGTISSNGKWREVSAGRPRGGALALRGQLGDWGPSAGSCVPSSSLVELGRFCTRGSRMGRPNTWALLCPRSVLIPAELSPHCQHADCTCSLCMSVCRVHRSILILWLLSAPFLPSGQQNPTIPPHLGKLGDTSSLLWTEI